MIILIEGPDGYGKTTLCKELAARLQAEIIKFPNEKIESGKRLRGILNREYPFEPMSFQALQLINRLETYKTLNENKTYVMDRGKISGIVYALADGLPEEWVRKTANYIPDADLTIFVTGKSYRNDDDDRYSDHEYQDKIKKLFDLEYSRTKNAGWVCNSKPVNEMADHVIDYDIDLIRIARLNKS